MFKVQWAVVVQLNNVVWVLGSVKGRKVMIASCSNEINYWDPLIKFILDRKTARKKTQNSNTLIHGFVISFGFTVDLIKKAKEENVLK